MYPDKHKMTMLGNAGEKVVEEYFRERGHVVASSTSIYDNIKDLVIDGKFTIEVKTQQLFHRKESFSIKHNQLSKCLNVDYLIFVETPSIENGDTISIWGYTKDKRQYEDYTTKDGRKMYLFPKVNGTLLKKIKDAKRIKEFRQNSNSDWKGTYVTDSFIGEY